ncbi:hypothetical protein STXM2123_93 [Streptomyces sp. F-3]|jgi:hypothetical protein|uniref:hypothetical protein n=1 Tax=Streptomyces TaxID=1883 RepID=UPI0007C3A615|nr:MULTISPECIES: hypothetical protein [Streptomyces]MDN5381084.1 hypothetical protein [Streptomyces sp. LB8]GAT79392.1 hypothetical protein STXM2123_93 [Streptomyces sp. F-3]
MPRPTAAQLVYGSCTVIFSTLVMLLLSGTSSGPGIVVVAVSALALGLVVALTAPLPKTRTVRPSGRPATVRVRREPVSAGAESMRGRTAS